MKTENGKWRAIIGVLLFFGVVSCVHQQDSLVGHWTAEKVNVDFDENIATPEMVRQLGELDKNNSIDITSDSLLVLVSNGDTLTSRCSLRGQTLFSDGKPFAQCSEGRLITEETTPLGKVTVQYTRQK